MTGRYLVVYYVIAFLLEEKLSNALGQGGLELVWKKSKLLSLEFCIFYYPVIFYFWGFWLPKAGEDLWLECRNEPGCRMHLRPSPWWWVRGNPRFGFVDLADIQWREFRGALSLLALAAAGLAALVRLLTLAFGYSHGVSLRLLIGLGFVGYVHGAGIVFPAVLVLAFYVVTRAFAGTRRAVPLLWLLALAAIAAKEPQWPLRHYLNFRTLAGPKWAWLDGRDYQGEYDWAQSINLILLRLLSFSLDCHGAALKSAGGTTALASLSLLRGRYSLPQAFSHAFYAPVVLAGPTICFDDYVEQCASPARVGWEELFWYVVRLVFALMALEAGMHAFPCFALARSGRLGQLGPRLGAAAVFFTLNLMWLKFLLLWRVARAWALAEGIDIPENMRRALCNHYSLVDFWRCWHASFNRWLVKYVYVPAGGRDRKALAAAVTFSFVALWHDAEAKLLAWGGLNAAFLALETVVSSTWQARCGRMAVTYPWLHRQIGALAGATYIMVLMAVNMIGYSVGISGISGLLSSAVHTNRETFDTLLGAYAVLFSGVQVMLELRKLEGFAAPHPVSAQPATPSVQEGEKQE